MRRTTRQQLQTLVCLCVLALGVWAKHSDNSSCVGPGKVLTATTMSATEHFTWSKSAGLDEGDSCKWIIRSSLNDGKVKLTFPIFNVINGTKASSADCIEIYDDEIDDEHSMDTLCGNDPQQMYISRNRSMLVVFTRGDSERNGSFTFIYVSEPGTLTLTSSPKPQTSSSFGNRTTLLSTRDYKPTSLSTKSYRPSSPPQISPSQKQTSPESENTSSPHRETSSAHSLTAMNTEKTVRVIGIIAATLAAIGVTFVVLKVTKCCRCLRKKDNSGMSHVGSSLRERERLAAHQDGGNVHSNNRTDMSQPLSNNDEVPSTRHTDETVENVHESDSDSQQDVNELPPSYESLYLNEQGEEVTPPRYSPPAHHSSHPPRRVHTFN
ncbi:hypothetical protein BsWGS_24634 [Bradybaena similaris]